jgi:hypothetical protein
MQIFYSLTVILMFSSFIMSAVNASDNILKEIEFDFKSKILNKFEVKTKSISKSKHKNYLKINANDNNKQLKLSEFLSDKLIQFSDKLDLIQIIPDNEIKIIVEEEILPKNKCKLKQLIESREEEKDNQVCPFDWNIDIRKNKFPFHRAFATCKCSNCQAIVSKNIVTACRPDYMLFPVLFRESFDDKENLIENWKFYLEKVAVSCSCSSFTGL